MSVNNSKALNSAYTKTAVNSRAGNLSKIARAPHIKPNSVFDTKSSGTSTPDYSGTMTTCAIIGALANVATTKMTTDAQMAKMNASGNQQNSGANATKDTISTLNKAATSVDPSVIQSAIQQGNTEKASLTGQLGEQQSVLDKATADQGTATKSITDADAKITQADTDDKEANQEITQADQDLSNAQTEYDKVNSDSNATPEQKDAAKAAYDKAKEAATEKKEAATKKKEAAKTSKTEAEGVKKTAQQMLDKAKTDATTAKSKVTELTQKLKNITDGIEKDNTQLNRITGISSGNPFANSTTKK